MKIYPFYKVILIILFTVLMMVPVTAQEAVEGEELDTVEMSFGGYISFDEEGNVYIDGYFLAPAGAISPSVLSEGQYVWVSGVFLNDDTFKLTEIDTSVEEPFESVDEGDTGEETTCDSTGATEDTADDCVADETGDTGEETGEEPTCDSTGATEDTADDCVAEEEEVCSPDGHPVAARIADAFDVDACEVEALHDEGNGFGNIAKAYLLAEAANQALMDGLAEGEVLDPSLLLDPTYFIDMHHSGMGWGQIIKSMNEVEGIDIHPSDLAPGKLKKRAANDDDTDETTEAFTSTNGNSSNGRGNGNANANSNNGKGKNKDKGNNGNGNNGNGNGKDKGKKK